MKGTAYPTTSGIYTITCSENGKVYVGKAQNFNTRKNKHWSALQQNEHANVHLQNAWNKYGAEAFTFAIVEVCPDRKERAIREAEVARDLGAMNRHTGFNLKDPATEGPDIPDPPKPEGTQMPPLLVPPKRVPRPIDPSVTGITRDKMSAVRKGVPKSEDTRMKMSIAADAKRTASGFNWDHARAIRLSYLHETYHRPGGISLLARHLGLKYHQVYEVVKGLHWIPQHLDKGSPLRGGHIHVICGPMFSSKSSELLRLLRAAEKEGVKTLLVKPVLDTRYAVDYVVSHDGRRGEAVPVSTAQEIAVLVEKVGAKVVGVDEVQFFDSTIVQVCEALASQGVDVFAAGLDADYRGQSFGPMPHLFAVADTLDKRASICSTCGGIATRSQRVVDSQDQIVVGGRSAYEARCRKHWNPEPVFAQGHGRAND